MIVLKTHMGNKKINQKLNWIKWKCRKLGRINQKLNLKTEVLNPSPSWVENQCLLLMPP
jgi:hypothetical protein